MKTVIFMWKCKGSFDLDFLYKQFSGKGEILSEKSMYATERVFRHSPCIFLISLTFSCKILNQSLSDRLDYRNLALSVNRDNLFRKGFFFNESLQPVPKFGKFSSRFLIHFSATTYHSLSHSKKGAFTKKQKQKIAEVTLLKENKRHLINFHTSASIHQIASSPEMGYSPRRRNWSISW